MINWWNELSFLQQIFACVAIPSTVVLIIQVILFIVGFSDLDSSDTEVSDTDFGEDLGSNDFGTKEDASEYSDGSDVRLFTIRSIVAFLSVGGWTGVVLGRQNLSLPAVTGLSLMAGFAALYFVTWSFRMALRLQSSGNIRSTNAIGKVGQVYITIPAANKGYGKVNVTVQERFCEFEAVTSADRDLKTGESVFVTGVTKDNLLTVIPNDEVSIE